MFVGVKPGEVTLAGLCPSSFMRTNVLNIGTSLCRSTTNVQKFKKFLKI